MIKKMTLLWECAESRTSGSGRRCVEGRHWVKGDKKRRAGGEGDT